MPAHRSRRPDRARSWYAIAAPDGAEVPGVPVRAEGPRPREEAPGDRLGPRRRHHAELRRLAHPARTTPSTTASISIWCSGATWSSPSDYRGSIGYGQGWRQGVYSDLGGKDYGDIAAGVDYLEGAGLRRPATASASGASATAASWRCRRSPDAATVPCAIDVAGVEDWTDWFQRSRRPVDPRPHGPSRGESRALSAGCRRSTIDRIERPLLVLHGTADVNVPFVRIGAADRRAA